MARTEHIELDRHDRRLLQALQDNARLSNVELSQRVHLSPSQCQRRLKRLERLGVVREYVARLEPDKVGLGVSAFVHVTLEKHGQNPARAFQKAVGRYPQILECWAVTGDADYLLRVVAPDLKAFSNLLMHELLALPMVAGVRSNLLLEPLKDTTALPLGET